jgi:hypothetical protein
LPAPGAALATIGLLAQLGCAALGGVRPRYAPLPGSVTVTVAARADSVTALLAEAARQSGLEVETISTTEGYLETAWFRLDTRTTVPPPASVLDRTVKLRFFADPVAGRTRLIAECAVRIAFDPSLPERDLERMVPEGHPGRELLAEILRRVSEGGTP